MDRAQTLKMAKSNAGLVPTNKLLPPPLFFATFHVKSRPFIKVGYRIKGRVYVINGYVLFVFFLGYFMYLLIKKKKLH